MKVLVTGASGRVGANLVKALLEGGHEVRAHVFPGDAGRADKLDGFDVEVVRGDFRDLEGFRPVVRGTEVIYHIGAAMRGPFDNVSFFDTNVVGTRNVIESALQERLDLHRFVYACTDAIYPPAPGRLTTEEMGMNRPKGMYSFSKWLGEHVALYYHEQHKIPVVSFRFAYVIGAGEILQKDYFPMFWLSHWVATFKRRKDPQGIQTFEALQELWEGDERLVVCRNPDGQPHQMHLVDVRDLVQGLLLGMERPEAVGEAFTLPGPCPTSWEEAVPYLSERLGIPYVEATVPGSIRRAFDLSKARERLGYAPEHDLASMVDLALEMERGGEIEVVPTGEPYA
ncbi:MAG: NAD(P)-dependent oxidoreductase [Candidatus Latescibacteria bacterium]|nr:NAD(P)-dependent oxidoreductase [Candidatus Latescibacterota bacterium]